MKQLFGIIMACICLFHPLVAASSIGVSKLAGDLAHELKIVMTMGGDDRLVTGGGGLNKYFTGPQPQPAVIARSSSTSSNVSQVGFLAAQQLFNRLHGALGDGDVVRCFEHAMKDIRQQVKYYWGAQASAPCYVITTPSGSDAEMLPTIAALLRKKEWQPNVKFSRPLVVNIVIASGEVGSGTVLASKLCHFSSLAPVGKSVEAGTQIAGVMAGVVEVVEIKIRNDQGVVVSDQDLENRLASLLHQMIEQNQQQVVLHMVHACKTGLGAPRDIFLQAMKQKYKDDLVVVVDAAQLRVNQSFVGTWLDSGFWVFLTGSKFLGGPSFSGALLIPSREAELLAAAPSNKIPLGLGDYFTPADCDDFFVNMCEVLPVWYNVGLSLRWAAALAEVARFCSVPVDRQDRGINHWAGGVRSLVKQSKRLKLLEEAVCANDNGLFHSYIGKCNSVVSFGMQVTLGEGRDQFLNLVQLRKVYELMTLDLSDRIKNLSSELQNIAATPCLIGQPVQVATTGPCTAVLRIAIAVPEIFKAIGHERVDPAVLIDEILYDDQLVVQKLDFIATYWAELSA